MKCKSYTLSRCTESLTILFHTNVHEAPQGSTKEKNNIKNQTTHYWVNHLDFRNEADGVSHLWPYFKTILHILTLTFESVPGTNQY